MRSSLGCLTVSGAAAAVSVTNGLEASLPAVAFATIMSVSGGPGARAQTPSCHGTTPPGGGYTDTVSAYGSACTISGQTYGTAGICLASISNAISCALSTLTSTSGSLLAATLTVGNGSPSSPLLIDLTHDLSLPTTLSAYPQSPAFEIANPGSFMQPSSASCTAAPKVGCLTITGNSLDPAGTVITSVLGQQQVKIVDWSHVLIQGITFRTPAELMDQGTWAGSGAVTLTSPDMSTTLTFPTVTIDIIPQTGTPQIENPTSFFAFTQDSSTISFSPGGTYTATISSGGTCSTIAGNNNATIAIILKDGSSPVGANATYSIVTPAICTDGYPTSPNPVPTAFVSSSNTITASIYVAYTATPLAQWISNLNSNYAMPGKPQFSSFLKAYTIQHLTSVSSTATNSTTGSITQNLADWGAPNFGHGQFDYIPPAQSTTLSSQWTLTLNNHLPNHVVPPYFADLNNYVCAHVDDSTVYEIDDLKGYVQNSNPGTNAGSDIIFDHVVWVNTSRGVFHGAPNSEIMNSAINRDTLIYASQTITSGSVTAAVKPCYGSVNGGPQFSQVDQAPTYGNTINNYSPNATADDSLAMYNDVGGFVYPSGSSYATVCSSTCAQSNVTSSTIQNADQFPIRLHNNTAVTGIPDVTSGTLDSGSCTSSVLGTTGSPVCVDSNTVSYITMTTANCDTWALGAACPVLFDFGN